jgi:hypothetical protein
MIEVPDYYILPFLSSQQHTWDNEGLGKKIWQIYELLSLTKLGLLTFYGILPEILLSYENIFKAKL